MSQPMVWRKDGLIASPMPTSGGPWSHAMIPTPVVLDDRIRVYYSVRDKRGRGVPMYVDLDRGDPKHVLQASAEPLLAVGAPGAFDDNGVVPTSVVRAPSGQWLMYYVGFELCTQVRYRLMTGLAVSDDGVHFERYQTTAILDRSPGEELFRCGPFVLLENGVFRLWYIAGNRWTEVGGKELPIYELRYLESEDGVRWGPRGQVVMELEDPDEHGFGRPWVRPRLDGYEMFFSVRKRSVGAYRLAYALSRDGLRWERQDERLGLTVSTEPGAFDSQAICYGVPVTVDGRDLCFYNGNDFGLHGFAVATLL